MEVSVEKRNGATVLDIFENQSDPVVAKRRALVYKVANAFDESSDQSELPQDAGTHHQISIEAIASYSELLGNGDDYDKTVREIMYIREHGEPMPDLETSENAWTSAYDELDAKVNGMPMVMAMSDEPTGIMKTRSMLGLPTSEPEIQLMSADPTGIDTYALSDDVSSTIASLKDQIEASRESFLKSLKHDEEQLHV